MLTSNYAVSSKPQNTARTSANGHPPGHVISYRIDYGLEAGAAGAAGSAGEAAPAAAPAPASAAGAAGAAAGGVASAAGAGASVLPPQALSTNAATRALKASLVFIYRYPRNLLIKVKS